MSRTKLRLQSLEARDVPSGTQLFAVAEDGGASRVAVYQPGGEIEAWPDGGPGQPFLTQQGRLVATFAPYPGFGGGVRVAVGDVTGDGIDDVITGAGFGGGPHVKIYDGAELLSGHVTQIREFFAFDNSFKGGVFVAVGQLDPATRQKEIIVGAGESGGPHVRVFAMYQVAFIQAPPDPNDYWPVHMTSEFFAYDKDFRGGVRITAGDVNGDGRDDLVTAAGPGGGPHVRVFDVYPPNPLALYLKPYNMIDEFFAYDANFHGGVYVAAGNVKGDARFAEVVTGPGKGGGPHLKVFSRESAGKLQLDSEIFTGRTDTNNTGGVRVGLADLGNNPASVSPQVRPLTIYVTHGLPDIPPPYTGPPGTRPLIPPVPWPAPLVGYNFHFGSLDEVSLDPQPQPFDGDQNAGWFSGQ